MLTVKAGRGTDFYRIRPYETSESARHVDWRATAHTGALQVREFVREQERSLTLFLDLAVDERNADWFEHAVDCCAYLAWSLHERSAPFHFLTQKAAVTVAGGADVYDILKHLARAEREPQAKPLQPHDRNPQVVLSVRPQILMDAGWTDARILTPDNLPVRRAEEAGTDKNLDHRSRADRDRHARISDSPRQQGSAAAARGKSR